MNPAWKKPRGLKKRRKLYQHGEKDIKLLHLRGGYSKTPHDIVDFERASYTLDRIAISL